MDRTLSNPPNWTYCLSKQSFVIIVALCCLFLSSFIISSFSNQPALAPTTCNCVIFRYDDLQDHWISTVQIAVLDVFLNKGQPLSVGVILDAFGNDSDLVEEADKANSRGLFEFELHGWDHVDYRGLTLDQQKQTLADANNKLDSLFGKKTNVFIPPFNTFNSDTITAMQALGLQVISSETGLDKSPYYSADGTAQNGPVYHMPQMTTFANHVDGQIVYYSNSKMLDDIDSGISKYGYAVVVIHPQDFRLIDSNGTSTSNVDIQKLQQLSDAVDAVALKGITFSTFSEVAALPHVETDDTVPPTITAPSDVAEESIGTLTQVKLGNPTVSDNADPSPKLTNNATANGFPVGTTTVTWTATDAAGNSAYAQQFVTIANSADKTIPAVNIVTPTNNLQFTGPTPGTTIKVTGTASDTGSGVKLVEVRSTTTSYEAATPKATRDWSTWTYDLPIKQSGTTDVIARATDYFGNQKWSIVTITAKSP